MVINVPTASLEGQVALITGAGRGIGRGCAIELGKRGASVIVNYVSSEGPANEVCEIIKGFNNGAKAIAIKADVSKVSEINRLFEEAKKAFGKINIVMSNSGTESWDVTEEISEEKYDHVFNLNTRAQFFVGQTAYKHIVSSRMSPPVAPAPAPPVLPWRFRLDDWSTSSIVSSSSLPPGPSERPESSA